MEALLFVGKYFQILIWSGILVFSYINGELGVLVKQRMRTSMKALIAVVAVIGLFAVGVQAVSAVDGETQTANTLRITPVRNDIQVKAGTKKVVKTTITNLTNAPVTVRPITNDFIAGDERGTPALILDSDKFAPTHSLKKFMGPLDDVTIPANDSAVVEVVITVPKDAQAGGYFGAVRFAPTNPDGGGQVNLSASVASLILMTVPGPVVEKLTLTDFDIQQGGKNGTYFRTPNDLQVSFRFASDSNVQVAPFGKISVKQGDTVVYEYDFNNVDPKDMILPDSARRWDVPLKNIESLGHYTVYATMTYGQGNQTIETSQSFWVIPWIVIIGVAAAILLLVGVVVIIILVARSRRRRMHRGFGNGRRRY